jgi:hypothetical protein
LAKAVKFCRTLKSSPKLKRTRGKLNEEKSKYTAVKEFCNIFNHLPVIPLSKPAAAINITSYTPGKG